MANIKVMVDYTIVNGQPLTFKSPADCSQVTGLVVCYPEGGTNKSKTFQFADAHGNNVGDIDLFAEDVLVKVILDVDASRAYVQNADTNAYLEAKFDSKAPAGYGLGAVIAPLAPLNSDGGHDANLVAKSGFWRANINAPTGVWVDIVHINHSEGYATQIGSPYNSDDFYVRTQQGGAWGKWARQATTDYALARDGSNAMTGALELGSGLGSVNAIQGLAQFQVRNWANDDSYRRIFRITTSASKTVAEALEFLNVVNGQTTNYTILHTGNKPSGSYTGNGDATERTINTGGIGNVCMVKDRNNSVIAFCTPSGVIYTQWRNGTSSGFLHLGPEEGNFTNGVLTMATTKAAVNYNGSIYDYQVL